MVIGEPGSGKTYLAKLVEREINGIYAIYTGSAKQCLLAIAEQIPRCPTTNDNDKTLTTEALRMNIAQYLEDRILIIDNIQRFPASLKFWLEQLLEDGHTMLLIGTRRDLEGISFKMPRIKLEALSDAQVRSLILEEAAARDTRSIPNYQLGEMIKRAAGNPMLAKRLLDEFESGVDDPTLQDGGRYLDISPMLMAELAMLGAVRFLGMALNDRSLYIIGGLGLTLFVAFRYIRAMLPKEDRRK